MDTMTPGMQEAVAVVTAMVAGEFQTAIAMVNESKAPRALSMGLSTIASVLAQMYGGPDVDEFLSHLGQSVAEIEVGI